MKLNDAARVLLTMAEMGMPIEGVAKDFVQMFGCCSVNHPDTVLAIMCELVDLTNTRINDLQKDVLLSDVLSDCHTITCRLGTAINILTMAVELATRSCNTLTNKYSGAL